MPASTSKVQLGILSNLYLSPAYASPTWSAVGLVGDCTVNAEDDKSDVQLRMSRVKFQNKTMKSLSVTAKLLASLTDTQYASIIAAAVSDAIVTILVLNGPSSVDGVRGYCFDAQVTKGSEDQGPGGVVFTEVEFVPAFTGNSPCAALVTSGAPVLTPL